MIRQAYSIVLARRSLVLERVMAEKVQKYAAEPEVRAILLEAAKGGRRFRPLLLLLVLEGVGGKWREGLEIACGIEFIHKASLVHDDLIDEDKQRRGVPSFWFSHGSKLAVVTGDALVGLAFNALHEWAASGDHPRSAEICSVFSKCMYDMSVGEILDLSFESRNGIDADAIDDMAALKSGSLIAACCRIGALIGNASDHLTDSFSAFGWHLGVAFQIINDLNNVNGVDQVSKGFAARDLILRKKTRTTLALERECISADDIPRMSTDQLQRILLPVTERVKEELSSAAIHLENMPSGFPKRVFGSILCDWRDKWFWTG